jgi:hypothetical protein
VERALRTQMGEPGFPVRLEDVPARLGFRELCEGMVVELADDLVVTCARSTIPAACWRIGCSTRTTRSSTRPTPSTTACPDPKLVRLAAGADLLIYDAQYDDAEYSGEVAASRAPAGATAPSAKGFASPMLPALASWRCSITIPATATTHVAIHRGSGAKSFDPARLPARGRPDDRWSLKQRAALPSRVSGRRMSGFLIPLLAMPKPPRLQPASESNFALRRVGRLDRRSVLMALLELMRTEVDLDTLLRRVVDLLAQAMDADRATLFLVDKQTRQSWCRGPPI